MKNWKLWFLTLFIISAALIIAVLVCPDETSALGSILAAASGFIAVIWFYNSLQLQSIQLQEQRKQFQLEFNNLRMEAKRSALLVAREILSDMEIRVENSLKGIGTINDLHVLFVNGMIAHANTIIDSDNPAIVLDEFEKFSKILIPIRTFLYSFKEAASIILENENIVVIDDKGLPEWFVVTYEKYLQGRPFISRYLPSAQLLSSVMTPVKMEVITLAWLAATGLRNPKMVNDEGIKDMINFRNKDPKATPRIVEKYLDTLPQETRDKFGTKDKSEGKAE